MESEYASLSELVLSQGIPHQEVLSAVHSEVLAAFEKLYPRLRNGARVLVDEKTGVVRIYNGKEDITPLAFEQTGASVARETLLALLKNERVQASVSPSVANVPKRNFSFNIKRKLIETVFWVYNTIYTVYSIMLLIGMIDSVFRRSVQSFLTSLPASQLVFGGLLLLTPVASIIYALTKGRYKNSETIVRFFFVLELPILALSMLILLLFPSMPLSYLFFTCGIILIPLLLFIEDTGKQETLVERIVHTTMLLYSFLCSSYLLLLYFFFLPALIGVIFQGILRLLFMSVPRTFTYAQNTNSFMIPPTVDPVYPIYPVKPSFSLMNWILQILGVALPAVGIIALVVLPVGLYYVLLKKTLKSVELLWNVLENKTWVVVGGVSVGFFVLLLFFSYSSSGTIPALFEQYKTATTYEQQRKSVEALSSRKVEIQREFQSISSRNFGIFLSPKSKIIKQWYSDGLPYLPDFVGDAMNILFIAVSKPLQYQGFSDPDGTLAQTYAEIFGENPYASGQILRNYTNTPQSIQLVSRRIDATTALNGTSATISVTDEFSSTSFREEEVIYEFSLPQEAVVTSIALGPELEFPGVFAPRGAARKTYEQQLVRRKDPAILEQVGPHQYRLRVYPIPAQNDQATLGGRNQKVRYTYITPLTNVGYALPNYGKTTNLKDVKTASFSVSRDGGLLSQSISDRFVSTQSYTGCNEIKDLGEGEVKIRRAMNAESSCPGTPRRPVSGKRIALLLDLSKGQSVFDVQGIVNNISSASKDILDKNQVDIFRFSQFLDSPIRFTSDLKETDQFIPFGKSDLSMAFNSLREEYDAVVVYLSPDTATSLSTYKKALPRVPVYFIFVGQSIPVFDDQLTISMMRNKGMVVDSFDEVLTLLALPQETNTLLSVTPRFTLELVGNTSLQNISSFDIRQGVPASYTTLMNSLPAELRQQLTQSLIRRTVRSTTNDIWTDIGLLDLLEQQAEKYTLVTPFTAAISLVNARQQQDLETQMRNGDRYTAGETIPQTQQNGGPLFPTNQRSGMVGEISRGITVPFSGATTNSFSSGGMLLSPSIGGTGLGGSSYGSVSRLPSFGGLEALILIPTVILAIIGFAYTLVHELRKLRIQKK